MPHTLIEMIQLHVFRKTRSGEYEHLILKRAPDEPVFPGIWQVITGYIEGGEQAFEAAVREMREETKLHALHIHVVPFIASFYHAQKDAVELIPVFCAEVNEDAVVLLSREHSDFAWLLKDDALTHLVFPGQIEGLRILNDHILNGSHADSFIKIF